MPQATFECSACKCTLISHEAAKNIWIYFALSSVVTNLDISYHNCAKVLYVHILLFDKK